MNPTPRTFSARRTAPRPAARVACVLLAAALAATASAQVTSWNFNTDAEGWTIADLPGVTTYATLLGSGPVTYHASGGTPDGYISGFDPSNNTYTFAAPTADLGDYSGYLGAVLTFSLRSDFNDWTSDNVVILRGSAADRIIVAAITPLPIDAWETYTIGLIADNFRYDYLGGATVSPADFSAVLGNLTGLFISAEYGNGLKETTGLDSVTFVAPVPEPATWAACLGVAALGLALVRRRR